MFPTLILVRRLHVRRMLALLLWHVHGRRSAPYTSSSLCGSLLERIAERVLASCQCTCSVALGRHPVLLLSASAMALHALRFCVPALLPT